MPTGPALDGRTGLRLSRRAMLAGGAAAALAACGGGSSTTEAATGSELPSPGETVPLPNATDVVQDALAAAGLEGAELALTPQTTWSELLVGVTTSLLLVVTDDAGELVTDPVDVWLVDLDGELAAGPMTTTWNPDDRLPTQGLHAVEVALEEDQTGTFDLVVATADGARAGSAGINAIPPAESIAPANGEVMPALATATTDDEMGVDDLCTREEDCGLHDVSLDKALGGDQPVVLCVSTPEFCATAICGPVLEDVLSVSEDTDDAIFIHVEPYSDAELTPVDLVNELQLPTEPWTWVLQSDGTIVERFPGPVLPDLLRAAVGAAAQAAPAGDATTSPAPTSSVSPTPDTSASPSPTES